MRCARSTSNRAQLAAAASALALGTLWAYWPVGGNGFVQFDDQLYIVGNPHVRSGIGLANLRWALTSAYASNWHPLTWISHQLDVSWFGLDAGRHHLAGLALHLAGALGLLQVLRRMTGRLWPSALVAALFALHPLHVESVAWAAERKDLLAGVYWVATMAAYLRYVRAPNRARYAAVAALLALGLAAKQMLVTLPLVLLLLDWWPLGRLGAPGPGPGLAGRRTLVALLLEKLPLLALSAAAAALALWAQAGDDALYPLAMLPVGARLANAVTAAAGYLAETVWPLALSYFYPLDPGGPPLWRAGAAALALAGLTVAALRLRRLPFLAVGWLWYGLTLLPVIGLVQVGTQARADRYTYLPLVGIFLALVWAADAGLARRGTPIRAGAAALALLVLGAAAALARTQVGYWHDTGTLTRRALEIDPDNWLALNEQGVALSQQGRHAEARDSLLRSIARFPGYASAHNNLGVVELRLGRPDAALGEFQQTVRLNPRYREAWQNQGVTLVLLGRVAEAEDAFGRLLRLDPESPEAHKGLGNIRLGQRRAEEAAEHFAAALRLRPDLPELWNNLGLALTLLGRREAGLAKFRTALQLAPGFAPARRNLGLAPEAPAEPGR